MPTHALRYREKARELYEAAASAATIALRDQFALLARQYELLAANVENLSDPQINNIGCESTDVIKAMPAERGAIGASIFPPLQAIPDTERLYENPAARRAWLLLKALENLPLDKALEIAQVAERFLSGDPSERRGTTGIFSRLDAKAVGLPATGETPVAVPSGICIEDHGWRSADPMNLTVLASTDDITRYLGQHGDLIASKDNLFVVNGQSEVTLDELLARANRMRVRQGRLTYTLLPTAAVVATANKAERRPPKPHQPPSRKEREQWARQVVKP
jgi:hypothetical protein